MKISIFGLGYVGAVSLACLARDGHDVVGVDIDRTKLDLIAAGKTPVVEEGMVELMQQVASGGHVRVTTDAAEAVLATDISLVCVGTPSAANGSQDQGAILRLAEQMGDTLKRKTAPHVVVFRSTLVPGTVEDVLRPIIEQRSGKRDGVDFFLCFQPEFLREGSSIKDYDKPPFTVVGANHAYPAQQLQALFGHLPCKFLQTSVRSAEMMKYCCNNFHALKITFANETARLCEALSVDPFEVMDLVCQDTQLNISRAYLRPGFAFRRLVPAQGPARHVLPGQDQRRGAAHAQRHPGVQQAARRARRRQGDGHRQAQDRLHRPVVQDRHRRPARKPAGHPGRAAHRQGPRVAHL